jgi:uncharacterized protein (DUF2345 family)
MSKNNNNNRQPAAAAVTATETPDQQYKVGPGCPPKEYQFKPGQSGNPKGAKRKQPSMALDLKAALERALNKKIKLKQGENERLMSMGQAGIEQLVTQFAKGDRHARRDLITLADRLGVDLLAGQKQVLQQALADKHQAILAGYVKRQSDQCTPSPVPGWESCM